MDPKMDPGLLPEAAPRLIFFFATKAFPGWSKQTCLLRQRLEPNWFKADLRLFISFTKIFFLASAAVTIAEASPLAYKEIVFIFLR